MSQRKVILITGALSGIGMASAIYDDYANKVQGNMIASYRNAPAADIVVKLMNIFIVKILNCVVKE